MTSGNSSSDQKPNLGKTILDDLKRGDLERTLRRDFTELKEFMLTEDRQKRLKEMKQVKRWLFIAWWFLESLFLKLTPARRLLLLLGILLLISNMRYSGNGGPSFDGAHVIGGLILVFIIMLELKDKLLAHEELEAGHAVQDALMPQRTPQVPGWGLWLFTRSANEVGGDLVDFIQKPISDLLGRVCGELWKQV